MPATEAETTTTDTVHIAAKVPPVLKARLLQTCKREDRGMSSAIRIAVTRYCESSEQAR